MTAALIAGATVALALSHGAYYPNSWGWASLVAVAAGGLSVVRAGTPQLGRMGAVTLSASGLVVALGVVSALRPDQAGRAVLEVERGVLYVSVLGAALLAIRRCSLNAAVAGVLGGIAFVSLVGLWSVLLDPTPVPNQFEGRLLYEPIGYANAMGILMAMGIALTIGCCASTSSQLARTVAAAALVPLVAALALTECRAAVAALLVAAGVTLLVDPLRGRLAATSLAVLPLPLLGGVVAWRSAVIDADAPIQRVAAEGRAVAIALCLLTFATGALRFVAAPRRDGRHRNRVAVAVAIFVLAASMLGGALAAGSLGDRAAYWRAAWADSRSHPVLGSGAGSFAVVWLETRDVERATRDAHSLYLETLAEIGPIGLAAVLALLVTPLVAGVAARKQPLIPAAVGAYTTFVVHAAVDWDWEVPGVVIPALVLGAVLLIAARGPTVRTRRVPVVVGASAVLVVGVALVGLIGNHALERGGAAVREGDWRTAGRLAETAVRWAPWSAEPRLLLGDVLLAQGDLAAARESYADAARRDRKNIRAWVGLARIGDDETRRLALARLAALDPLTSWVNPGGGVAE